MPEFWPYVESFSNILLACELLFCLPMLQRRVPIARGIAALVAYIVLFNSHVLNGIIGSGWIVSLTTTVIFFASVAAIHLAFECSKRQALFYGAAGYATENLIYYVRRVEIYFPGFPLEGEALGRFKLTVSLLVAVAIYLAIVKRSPRDHDPNVSNAFMLAFVVLALLVTNILNTWIRRAGLQAPPTALLAIICNMMLLMIEFNVFRRSSMEQERQVLEQLMVERERQQRLSQENVDLINIKCHDLKHQIAALRDMPAGDERDRTIGELEQAVLIYDSMARTGVAALDTVLTEKSLLCEARSIEFTCIVDGSCLAGIGPVDLYTLFGNALDNAIEAAEQIPDPEKRMIFLRVERQGAFARIFLENTCEGTVELVDGMPQTSKEDDRYHGFGLKSIRMIVDRLGGNMIIIPEDGRFSLSILLPADQPAK